MKQRLLQAMVVLLACLGAHAQVNSGSNGSDGTFNPTTNIVINMADHPNGIYQYTSINIPASVTVAFIPNANNTPVTWLVQSNCLISGTIALLGDYIGGGSGRPGGYRGGNSGTTATGGQGPGAGATFDDSQSTALGGNGSFGSSGGTNGLNSTYLAAGLVYGNQFLIPLLGGSGGGGSTICAYPGGDGGGAMLIAASGTIDLTGHIFATGGGSPSCFAGAGSGGAIRFLSAKIVGTGEIRTDGGRSGAEVFDAGPHGGGLGRVRFDTLDNGFNGTVVGFFTAGFQPIIIPTNGQGAQLTVTSVGGVPVSASPTGQLSTPDALLSAQQNNPISIVVHCANIPLNTQITVSVKPANGAAVSATGLNSTGTLSSSTATVLITMPRGGGLIYATAAN